MQDTKPAARVDGGGGDRSIQIADWKAHERNTLRGFFTAILPSGLLLHDLQLHQKGAGRWIAFPGREWVNAQGEKQYARFIEFRDRAAADRFRRAVLDALHRHLEEGNK